MIVNDNDMEVILNGSQEQVIKKMLANRIFCLLKLPAKKPERCRSDFSSSVFVSNMNSLSFSRALAIRNAKSKMGYEDCEYYLCIHTQRGIDEEKKGFFERSFNSRIKRIGSFIYPTVDELIDYLRDKELFLITCYMQYGNMEAMKVQDFLEKILFLWKDSESKFIRRDEFCDICIFLRRIEDGNDESSDVLLAEDIRNLKIRQQIVDIFEKNARKFYQEKYYSAEYETQSEMVQAAYFVTRFHSNTAWEADPVNIVNVRLSAFVLPGYVSSGEAVKYSRKKKTRNIFNRTEYIIDSIHCNSDIFSDISELAEYVVDYLGYFGFD